MRYMLQNANSCTILGDSDVWLFEQWVQARALLARRKCTADTFGTCTAVRFLGLVT
jgi:hypothetical protein